MQINKWTLGLAAVGLVSLTPGVMAQSAAAPAAATPIALNTALSATTISGYVDTSAVWNPGTGNGHPVPVEFNAGKQDGFNLDSADVKIARAPDAGAQWGAGYTFEAQYGPDALNPFGKGDAIRQAYVELVAPVGTGLDFQIGQWDGIIGYESTDDYKNPNWSRSYAKSLEPASHTGVLATYKFSDMLSAQLGVADSLTGGGNVRFGDGPEVGVGAESAKSLVSLISLTAPDSWGSLKDSELFAGFDYGQGAVSRDRKHLYVGTMIITPVKGLTFGAAYDAIWNTDVVGVGPGIAPGTTAPTDMNLGWFQSVGLYGTVKLGDKASLSGRAEWAHGAALGALDDGGNYSPATPASNVPLTDVVALTGTLQYHLWDNVISRLEVRWDHAANGAPAFNSVAANGAPADVNAVLVAANVIYKF